MRAPEQNSRIGAWRHSGDSVRQCVEQLGLDHNLVGWSLRAPSVLPGSLGVQSRVALEDFTQL